MFQRNLSSSLDAMESGVRGTQIPCGNNVDLRLQTPDFMMYPHETMTWTFQERSLDPLSIRSFVSTQNQPLINVGSKISGSYALTIESGTSLAASTSHSISISTDYPTKASVSNKLQSRSLDSASPSTNAFFDGRRREFVTSTSPKSAQCVVDLSSWNPKPEDLKKNTFCGFVDQSLLYQQDFSARSCNKFQSEIIDPENPLQRSSMDQKLLDESAAMNETTLPTSVHVVSEVSSPSRKQDQVFKSKIIEGFAVSNTGTIPWLKRSPTSKKGFELSKNSHAQGKSVSLTNAPLNKGTISPYDGLKTIRKQNGTLNSNIAPVSSQQDKTFLDGFAAGIRSRHVHHPHRDSREVLQTGGTHSGISVFNICETTYRPPLPQEQQLSYVEYTIDTQQKNLRVNKKDFPSSVCHKGKKIATIGLRIMFITCIMVVLVCLVYRLSMSPEPI